MLKKAINKIKKYQEDVRALARYVREQPTASINDKFLLIDLNRPEAYTFYLHNLLFFFKDQGYQIFLPKKVKNYKVIYKYSNHFLVDREIIFGRPENIDVHLSDKNLSPDYFTAITLHKVGQDQIIPISSHPLMYVRGQWNVAIDTAFVRKSIFIAGNFNSSFYKDIDNELFPVCSRNELYNYLYRHPRFLSFASNEDLQNYLDSNSSGQIVVVDRTKTEIKINELRKILAMHTFFLACPGVRMPLSHNIVEAMSVGAIPVLQKGYAEVMSPALVHNKNAIVFKDLEELSEQLRSIFSLSDLFIEQMSSNVKEYYKSYLTPQAVVSNIVTNFETKTMFMVAEHTSIRMFMNQKQDFKSNHDDA